jgi:hypothetical protein
MRRSASQIHRSVDARFIQGPRLTAPGPRRANRALTDTAGRLCTRGITPEQAADRADIQGDARLAAAALRIVSIIWTPPG